MYTVLLVDDEHTMLETLKNSIHWQQFGVDTLFTAADGVQAMEILSRHVVNLVITDIKMPHMDGITLLKSVRSLYPDTHIILLSAYTEFEYARQAVGLGAENYLLKPLQKGEFEESIERALENIYTNRTNSQQLFRNNIFVRWVNGTISGGELADRANLLNVNLYLPEYQTFILHKNQKNLSLSSYCLACVKQLDGDYDVHHFKDDFDRHVFILGGNLLEGRPIVRCFEDNANRMNLSHLITLSIGSVVFDADNLSQSYQVANSLLEDANFTNLKGKPNNGITLLNSNPDIEQEEELIVQQLSVLFHASESDFLADKCQAFADSLVSNFPHKDSSFFTNLLSHSIRRLFGRDLLKHPEAQEQINNRIRIFKNISSLDFPRSEIIDLLEYSYLQYRYYINVLSPIVRSAIYYIHSRYSENISIQEFCNIKKVSAPYLGFLFKKETGTFFNTYLTQYRISSSIPLLLDLDLKISDIAQQVGFSSTNYYITRFKQETGLSPIKYRTRATLNTAHHSNTTE